jgi:hypothetical protein
MNNYAFACEQWIPYILIHKHPLWITMHLLVNSEYRTFLYSIHIQRDSVVTASVWQPLKRTASVWWQAEDAHPWCIMENKLSFTAHQSCECDSSWLNFKFYIRRRPRAGQLQCMQKANRGERETRWKIDFTLKQSSRGKKFFRPRSLAMHTQNISSSIYYIEFLNACMKH